MVWKLNIDECGTSSFMGPAGSLIYLTSNITSQTLDSPRRLSIDGSSPAFLTYALDPNLRSHLIHCFLQWVNPYYQFLSPDEFAPFYQYPQQSIGLQVLQSSIFAAGACYSTHKDAVAIGAVFSAHAEGGILNCYRSSPDLNLVKSLSVMALRELSRGNDTVGWMYNCKFYIDLASYSVG